MEQKKKAFRGYSEEQTCKQGVPEGMVEQTKRFPLGRLISDHWWSFLDGYMKFQYVVWVTPEDVWKYKEIDEDGNIIGTPSPEDIVYDI